MRTKKAILNISSALLYQVVSIICGLILPRLILFKFGSTYNGVIASITQFLSMISILNIGIAGATRVALYKTLADGNFLETSRIMKATKSYLHKVGIGVLIYALVLTIIYPYISNNDLTQSETALLIVIISIASFSEYYFGISNSTLLCADQRGYIVSCVNIITMIINTIMTAILISLDFTIFQVKLGSSIIFLISPMLLSFIVSKKYNLIERCEPNYVAINKRGAVAFHSIANIIHSNVDLIVLTIFVDARLISVYSVYYMVVSKIKSIMGAFTSGLEAAFGDIWARQQYNVLRDKFNILEYMLFAFTSAVFPCVVLLIVPFVRQYTIGVYDTNYVLWDFAILITLAEAIYCIREPYLILIQATGKYEETKKDAKIEAAINVFLSVALVNLMGIKGVVFATLIANLYRTIRYLEFISEYIIKGLLYNTIYRILWLLLNSLCIVLIYTSVLENLPVYQGWTDWILKSVICSLIAIFVTLFSSLVVFKKELTSIFLMFSNVYKSKG